MVSMDFHEHVEECDGRRTVQHREHIETLL